MGHIKAPLNIIYRRYVISRIYVTLSILFSALISIYEPTSIYHTILTATKLDHTVMFLLVGICCVAALDIFVNDVLPDKYKLLVAYNHRHLIYMLMALAMFSISGAITYIYGSTFYLARLWLDGIIATVVAILDIFARHRGTTWR